MTDPPVFDRLLTLLAQGRSEGEPDHHVLRGYPANNDRERQEVEQLIDAVTSAGRSREYDEHVRLFVHRDAFVIYVPTIETDSRDRRSILACHGSVAEPPSQGALSSTLQEFASRLGRSVGGDAMKGAEAALAEVKKNPAWRRLPAWQVATAAVFGLLFVIWVLTKAF